MPKNTKNRSMSPSVRTAIWGTIGVIGVALVGTIGNIIIANIQNHPIPTVRSTETSIPPTFTITFTPSPTPTNTPTDTPVPITPTPTNQFTISVPANAYWFNTGITVKQGQQIEFEADTNDRWGSGISISGPDGDSAHNCDQRYILCENLGLLVGSIGTLNANWETLNPVAFKIGSASTYVVSADGILFLSMNENIGECEPGIPFSCFKDNFFSIEVTITVK